MKRIAITVILPLMAVTLAYSVYFEGGILDPDLIGTWVGSSKNGEEDGEVREWIQTRNADGTVTTHFTIRYEEKIIDSYTNIGHWWAYKGRFYETLKDAKRDPDVYDYAFIDANTLRFTKVANDGNYRDFDPYTFTETRANQAVDTTAANARLFDHDPLKSTNPDVEAITVAAVVSP